MCALNRMRLLNLQTQSIRQMHFCLAKPQHPALMLISTVALAFSPLAMAMHTALRDFAASLLHP